MNSVKFKLSMMMFLQFFIWGAWYPLVFGYLPAIGFNGLQQSIIVSTFNVAALAAIFGTQFVDRKFSAEKFLALSMLIGGLAMIGLTFLPPGTVPVDPLKPDGPKSDAPFWPFMILLLIHCVFYVPSISIANAIAFANVKDAKHDFGIIRLWGTIGWIAASWPFVFILVDWAGVDAKLAASGDSGFIAWLGAALGTDKKGEAKIVATSYTFLAAGIASLLLAGYSLLLPHTPPKKATGESNLAIVKALSFLKFPYILVLFLVTFIDAAVHQCYFMFTGRYLEVIGIPFNWVMPAMSIGQFAEIFTMAILGYFLKSLGWKWTMVLGVLGHALRFAVFAYVPEPWAAVAVILVHGICYAFFFATVYIFVDEYFPKDVRASAQGLFNVLILGIGPLFSNFAGPPLMEYYTKPGTLQMTTLTKPTEEKAEQNTINYARQVLSELGYRNPIAGKLRKDGEDWIVSGTTPGEKEGSMVKYDVKSHLNRDGDTHTWSVAEVKIDGKPVALTGALVPKTNFTGVFQVPMLGALIGAALLAFAFNPPLKPDTKTATGVAGEGESPPEPVV